MAARSRCAISTIGSRANTEAQTAGKFALALGSFPTFGTKPRRVPGGGNTLFVFATDPKVQQAAGAWLEHLLSPEGVTIWTKGTGYVPLRQDVLDDEKYLKKFMADNKNMAAATNQLKDTVSWVSFPGANGLQAEKVVVDARDEILKGTRPVKEMLVRGRAEGEQADRDLTPCPLPQAPPPAPSPLGRGGARRRCPRLRLAPSCKEGGEARSGHPYLYLLPAALVVGLFTYVPLARTLELSFFSWNMVAPVRPVRRLRQLRRAALGPGVLGR